MTRTLAPRLLALAFSCGASALPGQQLDRARVTASVDSLVRELRTSVPIPGMTVLIAQGSQPILANGYGVAHLDHDTPATPETIYGIASITKHFVAAAILKLESEGRLRLHDDVATFLPDMPMLRTPVTLRQLLHHTSGIAGMSLPAGRNSGRLDYTREEFIAAMREVYKDRPAEFAPGEAWAYRDVNYALLGFATETITGTSLWNYLRETFFTPLRMTSTAKCDIRVVVKRRAQGYVRDTTEPAGVAVIPYYSPTLLFGGAGLCSSATDLLTWQRALVENRVPGVAYQRLLETATLNDGRTTDYGFGLVTWPLGKHRMHFHTGGGNGFTSFLGYLPAHDATVVIMVNSNSDILRIAAEIARIVAGLPQVGHLADTREELARLVGTYEAGPVRMVVSDAGGRLEARITGAASTRFLFPVRLLKQRGRGGEYVVGWEPDSHVSFQVAGNRAAAATLRYGDRTVRLQRID